MENKHQVLLFDRLRENYNYFVAGWLTLDSPELIEKAKEIYVWHILSAEIREQTSPSLEQGVTMC